MSVTAASTCMQVVTAAAQLVLAILGPVGGAEGGACELADANPFTGQLCAMPAAEHRSLQLSWSVSLESYCASAKLRAVICRWRCSCACQVFSVIVITARMLSQVCGVAPAVVGSSAKAKAKALASLCRAADTA